MPAGGESGGATPRTSPVHRSGKNQSFGSTIGAGQEPLAADACDELGELVDDPVLVAVGGKEGHCTDGDGSAGALAWARWRDPRPHDSSSFEPGSFAS